MKKLLLVVLTTIFVSLGAFANEKQDILCLFDKYVKDANSYSKNLPNYYTDDARIIRVVNKKQGGQKAILIPYDRYLKELSSNAVLAKTVGYKNRYENRKIAKINNDYKVSATRFPRNDKKGLPCYFVYTKTASGWKIKEESMTTNVQTFLTAK